MMDHIPLPEAVIKLRDARAALQHHYANTGLAFTLDGKLVGDIGEAIAAEAFDLILCTKRTKGVDAHTREGRSVQIKATGSAKRGPAFTPGEGIADFLIFMYIDFDNAVARVVYNGPEAPIRKLLPSSWKGTKCPPRNAVEDENHRVTSDHRLTRK